MRYPVMAMLAATSVLLGCTHRTEITALPASPFNRCEPQGMPFYLPKPLLVVSKNVRHIDEAKVGLTEPAPIPNAFDDQASYADVKANVTTPGDGSTAMKAAANTGNPAKAAQFDETVPGIPTGWRGAMTPAGRVQDQLSPDSFFTYQIIFVPDLSQKYGLTINGNPGEVRAAMNLVNGWMYTGMGPFYLKDSSSAQNFMAAGVASMFVGRGVADVLDSVSGLASAAAGPGAGKKERAPMDSDKFVDRVMQVAKIMQSQTMVPREMLNYAEIAVYEPELAEDGSMIWTPIAHHNMNRNYFSPDMSKEASDLVLELIGSLAPQGKGQQSDGAGSSVSSQSQSDKDASLKGQAPDDPQKTETTDQPTETGSDTLPGATNSDTLPGAQPEPVTVPQPEPETDSTGDLQPPISSDQGTSRLPRHNMPSRLPAANIAPVSLAPQVDWPQSILK